MFMLREHKSGRNYSLKMGHKSFGDVMYFKY